MTLGAGGAAPTEKPNTPDTNRGRNQQVENLRYGGLKTSVAEMVIGVRSNTAVTVMMMQ
jgi:hypothetical protein